VSLLILTVDLFQLIQLLALLDDQILQRVKVIVTYGGAG
jgi:hypothetical protein